jgi:hypothetical protein
MTQVFVSYAQTDQSGALPIIEAIRRAGLTVWHVGAISPGDDFREQVGHEIEASQCVVVLWSEAAAQSRFVQQEIQQAIRAWSSDRLVLAALDDAPLPVGLRDLSAISIPGAFNFGTKQLIERAQDIVRPRALAMTAPEPEARASYPAPSARPLRSRWIVLSALFTAFVALIAVASLYGVYQSLPPPPLIQRPIDSRPPGDPTDPYATLTNEDFNKLRALFGLGRGATVPNSPDFREKVKSYQQCLGKNQTGFLTRSQLKSALEDPECMPTTLPPPPEPIPRSESAPLAFILILLVGGAAIGAGAVRVWIAWSRRRPNRAPSAVLSPQMPVESNSAAQVFVSYSRQDGPTVEQLVQQIEELGYAVWIDRQSTGVQRYAGPIVRAIRTSRVVALMCSQNAFASDHVIREVYFAGDCKKPFIIFQLDSTGFPDEILYFVSGFPRVPVATMDHDQLRSQLAQLVAA